MFIVALVALFGSCLATGPSIVNVSLPYEVDAMRCVASTPASTSTPPLVVVKQWTRLFAIAADTGLTTWNVSIKEQYNETGDVTLQQAYGRAVVLTGFSTWYGISVDTGEELWRFERYKYVSSMDFHFYQDTVGTVWLFKFTGIRWLVALNITTGHITANETLPVGCERCDMIVAAHFPFVLLRHDYDYSDPMKTECMMRVHGDSIPLAWTTTFNETEVEFYNAMIIGSTSASASRLDDVVLREGKSLQSDGYYLRFFRTYEALTGALREARLHTADTVEGCYPDGYTDFSNEVDFVVGSSSGNHRLEAFPAGAIAVRCYTSNPSPRVRTNLVNMSNFTQTWGQFSRIPAGFDGDHLILSPLVTWAVVNQGNEFSPRSVTVDAYDTSSGSRPAASSSPASHWPLSFAGYYIEKSKSYCGAAGFVALEAQNVSVWDPYPRTLMLIHV